MTTPRVVTVWPSSGEVAPVPWTSAIGVSDAGAATVNANVTSSVAAVRRASVAVA